MEDNRRKRRKADCKNAIVGDYVIISLCVISHDFNEPTDGSLLYELAYISS